MANPSMIDFPCPGSHTARGYYAPAAGAAGVVLLQEWWGLNEQMKRVADRCQAAGFDTLVPDLYEGRVTQDPDEAGHLMEGLDWVGATAAFSAFLGGRVASNLYLLPRVARVLRDRKAQSASA